MKAAQYTPQSPEEKVEGISVLLPLQARSGFVFLLAQTRKQSAESEALIQLLSDHVHRLAESFGTDAHAQQRFEQFLGALNETLAQHVREGHFRIPINQFDALVGIACDEQMFLSGTGETIALFLHRRPQQRYQIFNLSRSIQTEQALPTWEKAFAVVLDGDLHSGDVFVLSNQDLQRAIPPEDLNTVVTTLPPRGATERLRQYFPERVCVHLVVLKMEEADEPSTTPMTRATLKTDVSVNRFKEQEEATTELLEDQTPHVRTLLRALQLRFKKLIEKEIWKILWRLIRRLFWNAGKTALRLKTKEGRVEAKNSLFGSARAIQKYSKVILYRVRHIPRSTKYLATGVVAIAVVLLVSGTFLSASKARAEEQRAYEQQIEKIEELMERASGALIYKDENQARGLFLNASTLIERLPQETAQRQQKVVELKQSIQKATDEIRHLVTVPNPALLGDLASLTDGVFGQAFVKSGNELFVFASDGRVYQHDRTQKVFKPVSTQVDGSRIAVAAGEDDERIFALLSDQSVVEFARDESIQKSTGLQKPEGDVRDILAYARRLYLLATNQTDGQIYRYGRTGNEFGSGTRWVTSKTTLLPDARSFAIDGDIFVLQKNGEIARFESGAEREFEPGVVDPPLTNATDIWTDVQSPYLYVLEPDTKRIVVFKKDTGAFVVQYRSDAFQNASDLVVDEAAYSIYVLAGSKLYSIAPSHVAR